MTRDESDRPDTIRRLNLNMPTPSGVHPDAEPCAYCGAPAMPVGTKGHYMCAKCAEYTDPMAFLRAERAMSRRASHGGCPTCAFATFEHDNFTLVETRSCTLRAWPDGYGENRRWHYFTNNGKLCPAHKTKEETAP